MTDQSEKNPSADPRAAEKMTDIAVKLIEVNAALSEMAMELFAFAVAGDLAGAKATLSKLDTELDGGIKSLLAAAHDGDVLALALRSCRHVGAHKLQAARDGALQVWTCMFCGDLWNGIRWTSSDDRPGDDKPGPQ